jgi:hypothetical protein
MRIDLSGMLEAGADYKIGGVTPTPALIWSTLKGLWETYPLVELVIPSVETSVLVKLTNMLGTFDDFRAAATTRGYIDIQALEPV